MKFSEAWLREWVNPKLSREAIAAKLTMCGIEVEDISPAASAFTGIVVGQILRIEPHPEADRLQICDVQVKQKKLQIVCGAQNIKVGMKVPVALVSAELPSKNIIKPSKIRGVSSEGMLCSAKELGLTEEGEGILELPKDAPIGAVLWNYLALADYTFEVSITPNRGDCLSILGIAREVSAITQTPLKSISIRPVKSTLQDKFKIKLASKVGCPRYCGRIIRNVTADAETPIWLKERLRRSGIRSISPIVDVANYVMLELGQPMHAFDLNTLEGGIQVRYSQKGEELALLDGSAPVLDDKTMVIADAKKPLAIAGVMGGLDSSVTLLTKDVFLESAYFSPKVIARQRQFYNLNSDSAYRFERGIDPTIQEKALERATQLILEIAGGEAGPVIKQERANELPKKATITLPQVRIGKLLGLEIPDKKIAAIFKRLNFIAKIQKLVWKVTPPSYRGDITLPEDLLEEIARLYGYENIPAKPITGLLQAQTETNDEDIARNALSNQGFNEIISYSFIDKKLQALLDPDLKPYELINPISAEMVAMRTNLWPGLINILRYNKSRQQQRVRLFEIGTTFRVQDGQLKQKPKLAGLISGSALPEQWGIGSREVDFYDLKAVLENLLTLSHKQNQLSFKSDKGHPALHPGQSADIYLENQRVGLIGALHPSLEKALDVNGKVFLFELDLEALNRPADFKHEEVSKFPEIRRDIAILINQAIPSKAIQDTIKGVAGDWLKDVFIFDVYQGKGILPGHKSIAVALILQHPTRTLVDDEVVSLMGRVIAALKGQLGAELRS